MNAKRIASHRPPVAGIASREPLLWLLFTLATVGLVIGLAFERQTPPRPKDAAAPAGQFSAGRAGQTLARLLADGAPHPVGSPAHAQMRQRVLDELIALGLQPEMQTAHRCDAAEPEMLTCAYVTNILARLPGAQEGPALLLAAHYDSAGAGPGAADDGAGVAALLETARAWRALGPARSPLILLIDDGEELSLVGARAFLEHPWAKQVGAVINLEARGSAGPAILFETSPENAWLVQAYQAASEYPAAASLAYSVYEMMSSDTDMTVFREAGWPGLNFALAQNPVVYHMPQDNLANLSQESLQHLGDTTLSTARRLAEMDLSTIPAGKAVYQDWMSYSLLVLPQGAMPVLALLALAGLLAAAWRLIRSGELRLAQLGWGALAVLLLVGGSALLALGLTALLRLLSGQETPDWANPAPLRLAIWAGALLVSALMGLLFGRRAEVWGLGLGYWLLYGAAGLLAAVALPGVSFPFVLPTLLAGLLLALVAWVARMNRPLPRFGALMVVTAFTWLPLVLFFEAALGFEMAAANGAILALVLGGLLPLFGAASQAVAGPGERLIPLGGLAALTLAGLAWALLTPTYTPERPQPLNLSYLDDQTSGKAYWIARAGLAQLPAEMAAARPFQVQAVYPWTDVQRPVLPAESGLLSGPELDVVADRQEGGQRTVTVRLRSPRQAAFLELYLPSQALEAVTLDGQDQPIQRDREHNNLFWFQCQGQECDGLELTLRFNAAGPQPVFLIDDSFGLPPFGTGFQSLRPATAAPADYGDLTILYKRIDL